MTKSRSQSNSSQSNSDYSSNLSESYRYMSQEEQEQETSIASSEAESHSYFGNVADRLDAWDDTRLKKTVDNSKNSMVSMAQAYKGDDEKSFNFSDDDTKLSTQTSPSNKLYVKKKSVRNPVERTKAELLHSTPETSLEVKNLSNVLPEGIMKKIGQPKRNTSFSNKRNVSFQEKNDDKMVLRPVSESSTIISEIRESSSEEGSEEVSESEDISSVDSEDQNEKIIEEILELQDLLEDRIEELGMRRQKEKAKSVKSVSKFKKLANEPKLRKSIDEKVKTKSPSSKGVLRRHKTSTRSSVDIVPTKNALRKRLHFDAIDSLSLEEAQDSLKTICVRLNTPYSRLIPTVNVIPDVVKSESHLFKFAYNIHTNLYQRPLARPILGKKSQTQIEFVRNLKDMENKVDVLVKYVQEVD